jgi:DNA recombination protein RmuC
LQTVMQWLRALKIEESAKDIQKQVEKLSKHLGAHEEYLSKLWWSLTTTVNHFNNSYKKFNLIEKDIIKITDKQSKEELKTMVLNKPEL